MKKLLAIVLIVLIAIVAGYDIISSNDILYGGGRHKCGGSWVASLRNPAYMQCDKCGEWHEFK